MVVKEIEKFKDLIEAGLDLENCTLQGLDLSNVAINWAGARIKNTYFLGCRIRPHDEVTLLDMGAFVFRHPPAIPYKPFRNRLYNPAELMTGYTPELDDSVDKKIYDHFYQSRFNPNINEALWQRIHDHAIDDALRELIGMRDDGTMAKKVVAIMGGHSTSRKDENYRKIVFLCKRLTELGFFIASGGGPGIMEAANLGAYLAGQSNTDAQQALITLSQAPKYTDAGYLERAYEVIEKHPEGQQSLAIPTWFYGHEPSNLFSTHIAKYFSNSIREDNLLSIALHGVVFAPGSAGTFQEIFMDAAQNHYATFRFISPMIFLDKDFYENQTFIFPVLKKISSGKTYGNILRVENEIEPIIDFVHNFVPIDNNRP